MPHQANFSVGCKKKIARPPLRAAGGLTESEVSSRFVRVRRALRDANRNKTIWRLPIRFILVLFIEQCFSIELLRGEGVFTENTIQVMEGPPHRWRKFEFLKRPPFHLAMVRHAKRSIFKGQRLKWSHTSHARKVVESSFYLQIDRGLEREHSPG